MFRKNAPFSRKNQTTELDNWSPSSVNIEQTGKLKEVY